MTDIINIPHCSFCGKSRKEVEKLVLGEPNVYICNECVELCKQVLDKDKKSLEKPTVLPLLSHPHEIFAAMNEYVVGQDEAKKALSIAAYNHYKRVSSSEIKKSNLLMMGPTGCGKTLLAQTLAKILDVPFAMADATSLTEAGYVGEDVENILMRLIENADNDVSKAEKGIVYIDEIDKIAKKDENVSLTRDVSGEGVQQALLKIIEETVANVPPHGNRKHPHQELIKINTADILFIAGGAFVGIDQIINKRLKNSHSSIGFGSNIEAEKDVDVVSQVEIGDLKKYGLIPEFVGRFPVVFSLTSLSEDDLVKILVEPKNSVISQYQKMFEMDHIDLHFEDDSLFHIAKICREKETGARGLRSTIEDTLKELQFNIGHHKLDGVSKIIISKESIQTGMHLMFYEKELDNGSQ